MVCWAFTCSVASPTCRDQAPYLVWQMYAASLNVCRVTVYVLEMTVSSVKVVGFVPYKGMLCWGRDGEGVRLCGFLWMYLTGLGVEREWVCVVQSLCG